MKDASSLVFFPSSNDDAEKAAKFINNKVDERKRKTIQIDNVITEKTSLDYADELEKLYSLKKRGILTEEEYCEAKKKILSR